MPTTILATSKQVYQEAIGPIRRSIRKSILATPPNMAVRFETDADDSGLQVAHVAEILMLMLSFYNEPDKNKLRPYLPPCSQVKRRIFAK
jgi:hypothetical protein